jgi:uncharacterized protein (UPF0212 family)
VETGTVLSCENFRGGKFGDETTSCAQSLRLKMMMQPSPLYSRRTSFDDELLEDVSLSPLYVDYDLDCSSASSCSTQQQTSTASHNDSLLQDQLVALVSMEDSYRVQPSPPCLNATTTTPSSYDGWRRAICEWSYRVVDHFHVNRAAVGVALNLLDRYLVLRQVPRNSQVGDCSCPSCQRSVSSKLFQLAAMTALYIAVKLHVCEGSSEELFCAKSRRTKKLRLLSFVDLSRGQFTSQDITTMEKDHATYIAIQGSSTNALWCCLYDATNSCQVHHQALRP